MSARNLPLNPLHTIKTPEKVSFSLPLAGLGSRALALAFDYVLMAIVTLLVLSLWSRFDLSFLDELWGELAKKMRARGLYVAFIIFFFLLYNGFYFIFFEWLFMGQTPGKKVCGLRVVRDFGYPIGFLEAFLRNIIRSVDFLPSGYGIALLYMFTADTEKRLGDLVAGTLVVREEELSLESLMRLLVRSSNAPPTPLQNLNFRLHSDELELLADLHKRIGTLAPELRAQITTSLTRRFLTRLGKDEAWLRETFPDPQPRERFLYALHSEALARLKDHI